MRSSISSWRAHGDAKEVFGKAAHLGVNGVAGKPESGTHLVFVLVRHVGLKEHLHGQFAGFTACLCRHRALLFSRLRRIRELAAQADHFNGRGGGFKSLVSGLDAGAVQCLFQRFAG